MTATSGVHLVRTQALRSGEPLSTVTGKLASALGVEVTLLPATDDALRTWVDTPAGSFPFQEWFVARQHRDEVDRVRFDGEATATPAPGVLDALDGAELIVIAPSNPFISIWPILAVGEIRAALERRRVPCVAVSPHRRRPGAERPRRPDARSVLPAAQSRGASPRATRALSMCSSSTAPTPTAQPRCEADGVRSVVTGTVMRDARRPRRALAEAVLAAA